MAETTQLQSLLASLQPALVEDTYVFVTRPNARYGDGAELDPIASFMENEGLTMIVLKDRADRQGEKYHGVFRMITLQVHSELNAVGLTATVADTLAKQKIPANIVAAYHHDHVFVLDSRAQDALNLLNELMSETRSIHPTAG